MPFSYHSRKYTLNEDFFSKWSPTMAYVLGFWFADGYMRHDRSYQMTFSSNDHQHLEYIKNALGTNIPLTPYYSHGIRGKECKIRVHSKKLFHDLQNLGGERKKSLTMKFPEVPDKYLADFIRGYFDGDGSVHLVKYKRSKDGKNQIDLRSNFTSGSYVFLEALRDLLISILNLRPRKICAYGTGNQYKLGYGSKDTRKLLSYMYYHSNPIHLQRKAKYLDNKESPF